ncbi:MAG TPA: DUF6178 family protein [Vicinamibacterales bacterium]|jgi:hypothetical protein|nr:DUF6178 family protein [Vicinamibacterales bacterium]
MFLQRILDTPHLARAVARLQPELLHRVIRHVGLEDAGELVALATPEQLTRVFDLDLWQAGRPGVDEQFDAARFGTWLQILLEAGSDVAAAKLAAMAPDVVIAGLAQHARVADLSAVMPYVTLEGELAGGRVEDQAHTCDIGGYRIVALRDNAWDAIVEVLLALQAAHPDAFHRLMIGCRAVSSSRPEASGMHDLLDDPDQAMFDLALDRERRREQQGYVTPAEARAFLDLARRGIARETALPGNPLARAYFQALVEPVADEPVVDGPDASPADVAAVVEVLVDSGVLEPPVRALLEGAVGDAPRLARIHAALRAAFERDVDVSVRLSGELGFLANALISGCTLQARPFTPQEASDAVLAVCNLGLENWSAVTTDDVLVGQDLVGVFEKGWAILHERVGLTTARRLIELLTVVHPRDRDTQMRLTRLRRELTKHVEAGMPWRARASLEVIADLDLVAHAGLVGLLDECPVLHAAVRAASGPKPLSVSATAFEFVSENSQILAVDAFLASLPQIFAS